MKEVQRVYDLLRVRRAQTIIQSFALSLQVSLIHFTQFGQIKNKSKHVTKLMHLFEMGLKSSKGLVHYNDTKVRYMLALGLLWT